MPEVPFPTFFKYNYLVTSFNQKNTHNIKLMSYFQEVPVIYHFLHWVESLNSLDAKMKIRGGKKAAPISDKICSHTETSRHYISSRPACIKSRNLKTKKKAADGGPQKKK